MADKHATIVLTGMVQDAGFRGKVMRMAQKLDLVGYTENLPNGTVRIICEGQEAAIHEFAKNLDIHDDDIDVEDISVEWSDATGEFEWFEVKFDNLGMEMFQGFATAGKKLGDVSQKVDGVSENVKTVGKKIDNMNTDLKAEAIKTHEMLGSIDGRLDNALNRYDLFGKEITVIREDIGNLKQFANEFSEFKDLFALYVKHEMSKDKA